MLQGSNQAKTPHIPGAKIAIIYSKWYPEFVESMVAAAERVLKELEVSVIEKHRLPGSLELPGAAKHLLHTQDDYDAIIAFGVIVKGETFHFEMISHECSRGLGQVSLEFNTPILSEVLPVTSIEHARARSQDNEHNKGIEAAIAAAEIVAWRREVKKQGERALGF